MTLAEKNILFHPVPLVSNWRMPDKRRHRGPAPEDARLFAPQACELMRQAVGDLCWLINHGYALTSSLELVGNRYELVRRQRIAVARCVCADAALLRRQQHEIKPAQLQNEEIWLDGYNLLNALESAMAGGVILLGRDGCYRDIAGTHGSYRLVEETMPALHMLGESQAALSIAKCCWWLDKPVSNSGRLKHVLLDLAARMGWSWEVELVFNPDKVLSESRHIAATSDSVILDHCARWFNLARWIIDLKVAQANLVNFACPDSEVKLAPKPS